MTMQTKSIIQSANAGVDMGTHKTSSSAMAMKLLFHDLRPLPLYIMLGLTLVFFTAELVVSHLTHSLTLLVDSYHTLCNLIALAGCLITLKYGSSREHPTLERQDSVEEELVSKQPAGDKKTLSSGTLECSDQQQHRHRRKSSVSENKLRNTFGWARVEILVMLIGAVFLASLCFSLVVEAVQTLCHIGHSDEMHHTEVVIIVGVSGLVLNVLCYLLIGGYTFHQGSLLHVMPGGDVVLERESLSHDAVRRGARRLSARRAAAATPVPVKNNGCETEVASSPAHVHSSHPFVRQGPREMLRDVIGLILVIVSAVLVKFNDENVAKYVDPIISIFSALLLLLLSFPYLKESGRILLQTIPDYIDIESLKSKLVTAFPDIVNVHEVHIWCLTPAKVFATAHLVMKTHKDYVHIKEGLAGFFVEHGITHATIQPEFCGVNDTSSIEGSENECFLQCSSGTCKDSHCCSARPNSAASSDDEEDHETSCFGQSHKHSHSHSHAHSHNHSESHGHSHAVKKRRIAERQAKTPTKPPRLLDVSLDVSESPIKEEVEEQVTCTPPVTPDDEPAPCKKNVLLRARSKQSSSSSSENSVRDVRASYPSSQKERMQNLQRQRSQSESTCDEEERVGSGDLSIARVRQHSLENLQIKS